VSPTSSREDGRDPAFEAKIPAKGADDTIGGGHDDDDASMTAGQPPPRQNFASDSAGYDFSTDVLSAAGQPSTAGFSPTATM
jgi:hypothetical protein